MECPRFSASGKLVQAYWKAHKPMLAKTRIRDAIMAFCLSWDLSIFTNSTLDEQREQLSEEINAWLFCLASRAYYTDNKKNRLSNGKEFLESFKKEAIDKWGLRVCGDKRVVCFFEILFRDLEKYARRKYVFSWGWIVSENGLVQIVDTEKMKATEVYISDDDEEEWISI